MKKGRVLVIDDDPAMLDACAETLQYYGYDVLLREDPRLAVSAVQQDTFDLVLLDLKMPGMNGLDLLREIRSVDSKVLAVMITAFPTIATAVEAVREGAFDYLPKPFTPEQLLIVVDRAVAQKRLAEENFVLREALRFRPGFEGIVGKSHVMERVMDLVAKVADSDSSVVIEGETGTGKELIARSLHRNSPRQERPFLPVTCGTFPEQLLESELFGHERGAFTGAYTRKLGLLESAQGGTVFLDEISTLSLELQVKLLRVLQERQIRRVGGSGYMDIDIRVISATNEKLEEAVSDGRFRKDLYYRLNVITISLPPLRDRIPDIPLLVEHFLKVLKSAHDRQVSGVSREAVEILQAHDWPGNVRELQNVVERAFFLSEEDVIRPADFPAEMLHADSRQHSVDTRLPYLQSKQAYLEPFEKDYLTELLREHRGNVSRASGRAGMHRSTFQRLMRKHGIRSQDYRSMAREGSLN
jgi:DNA-binding NtrC family response regulator